MGKFFNEMASGTRKTKIVLSAADREHAIKLIEEGNRRSIVSMIYGVADSTISKWMKTRQASGITESAPKVERRYDVMLYFTFDICKTQKNPGFFAQFMKSFN